MHHTYNLHHFFCPSQDHLQMQTTKLFHFICLTMLMARSSDFLVCLTFAITAIFFLSLNLLPPLTGGNYKAPINEEELRKMMLGSKPPTCVNKCMSCRPCRATLVIPPHMNSRAKRDVKLSHTEDGSYYLLSWKCRCRDKLYQP